MTSIQPSAVSTLNTDPEEAVSLAARVMKSGGSLEQHLNGFSLPVYVTDALGYVIFFNPACRDFAGRQPVAGEDRWCVSWQLQTESGDRLPHEFCPMAVAMRERRPIRNVVAVAVRPDGTRVIFQPLPTPILNDEGELIGAVNVLIDVTDQRQASALKSQALRCRRLASSVGDPRTIKTLTLMADEYDREACSIANKGAGLH